MLPTLTPRRNPAGRGFHTVCKSFANFSGPNIFNRLEFAKDMTENRRLGYARVSTHGQTLDAQLEQLRGGGCRKVYREKASGAQADRRELQRLLKAIRPGDLVTVTRIDRPSICSPLSGRSLTPAGNSGHWRSHGPTPPPAPGD